MSRSAGTRIRAVRRPVVVIAGEDRNDREVLRILLEKLCPEMRGRIVEINDSVRLREASERVLPARVKTLARKARARAARENADLACVFVHEDLDRPAAGAYESVRARVQEALARELGSVHYVLVASEIEAWLLLFSETLAAYAAGWKVPRQYRGCDTAQVGNPKRVMMSEVSGSRRAYRESDAPRIIAKAVELDHLDRPAGRNESWTRLRHDARGCCIHHVGRRSRPSRDG